MIEKESSFRSAVNSRNSQQAILDTKGLICEINVIPRVVQQHAVAKQLPPRCLNYDTDCFAPDGLKTLFHYVTTCAKRMALNVSNSSSNLRTRVAYHIDTRGLIGDVD